MLWHVTFECTAFIGLRERSMLHEAFRKDDIKVFQIGQVCTEIGPTDLREIAHHVCLI